MKSWALGMELLNSSIYYDCNSKSTSGELWLLQGSMRNFSTYFFRNYQLRRYLRSGNLKLRLFRLAPWEYFLCLLGAVVLSIRVRKENSWENCVWKDIYFGHVTNCHFASKLGSEEFILSEISSRNLFHAMLDCIKTIHITSRLVSKNLLSAAKAKLYVFNGRDRVEASIVTVLKKHDFSITLFENGSLRGSFEKFNISPHASHDWWEKLKVHESKLLASPISKNDLDVALNFANKKMRGFDPVRRKDWNKTLGKNSFFEIPKEPYVLFFSSSTKEFSPFREFNTSSGFSSQLEAVTSLAQVCEQLKLKLIIRRHPNSTSYDGIDVEEKYWSKLAKLEHVDIVSPFDGINSYSLLPKAICVFVWISTIGFDSLCHGAKVRALGAASWAYKSEFRCESKSSIETVLTQSSNEPNPFWTIITYSHFMATYGTHTGQLSKLSKQGVHLDFLRTTIQRDDLGQIRHWIRRH